MRKIANTLKNKKITVLLVLLVVVVVAVFVIFGLRVKAFAAENDYKVVCNAIYSMAEHQKEYTYILPYSAFSTELQRFIQRDFSEGKYDKITLHCQSDIPIATGKGVVKTFDIVLSLGE